MSRAVSSAIGTGRDKCWKTVKLTPSDPKYLRNLRGQLRRATCWDSKEPK
jgi:hypothetical protein